MELTNASFKQVSDAIKSKKVSAVEVTKFFMARAEKLNPQLNAFITFNAKALEEAQAIDKKIQQNESVGPLTGVSFGIKDLLCTRDLRTTAGSKILSHFIPPYDSTVVAK